MVYYPDKQDFDLCQGFKDSQKINFNGTRFYYKQNSDKLIIFYHGNAGSACNRSFLKDFFEENDYSYIFVEYAGYSNDSKKPTKKLLLQDVENVNNFIKDLNYSELVLAGESIGTGLASYHSTLTKADKLFFVAPFSSIADVGQRHFFLYPVKLLLKENYDNELWLQDFKEKIMIIHGNKDGIIPMRLSKKLYESISTIKKKYVEIDGAGHNDIYRYEEVWNNMKDFFNE